ncbi:hypothetical protein NQ317_003338 [Molorchus minor]|uniref:Peptidase S1 domain-containing protein n=1 Tax=Molorchus minor TaxID=1323400 RepID=A0ABQ9JDW5_9CUCU|nr:hypothetical protein NQ317_003338 [Molorchus minor]
MPTVKPKPQFTKVVPIMDISSILIIPLCLFLLLRQVTSIIGGYEVQPHSMPYQVFLNITGEKNDTWICGGSLITPNYILTAGRCCYGYDIDSIYCKSAFGEKGQFQLAKIITIELGVHNITAKEDSQLSLKSSNFTIHPEFNMDVDAFVYEMDIAVITLPEPVKVTEAIQTIRLPNPYYNDTFLNVAGTVGGWGLTNEYYEDSYSPVLLAMEHRIMSNDECHTSYGDVHSYDGCMEISVSQTPSTGDFGSPLVINNITQVGIASQNILKVPSIPFIFTRVEDFLDWIKEVTDYEDDYTTTESTTETLTTASETTVTDDGSTSTTTSFSSTASTDIDTTTESTSTTASGAVNIFF